jgi:mutual gliding-motility protein MglA
MAIFNLVKREIDLKIVYCGPAMCGKTTNVQHIYKMLPPQQRGELVSLPTINDRTLFFDFLSIESDYVRGFKTRFHIYTVPGQVHYSLTRRAVLIGADGVVFVADSQTDKLQDNIESLEDLGEHLRFYKKDLTTFPFVLQYNKRDLPDIMPVDTLDARLNTLYVPAFESSAITGMGVANTLNAIRKIVLKHMESDLAKNKR